jgi:hypothetical protein
MDKVHKSSNSDNYFYANKYSIFLQKKEIILVTISTWESNGIYNMI